MPVLPHPTEYNVFFETATEHAQPHDWQRRLADESFCQSRLIDIPTGLGKTAGVVLAWFYNRIILKRSGWPRRLVFCLPQRTLVEQTEAQVRKWINNLVKAQYLSSNPAQGKPRVIALMGGATPDGEDADWDIFPEDNAILIGTQDVILSRALNRGYGMSRYRWPMHFALLNNDALWVMDEVQLMGVGVETTAQLTALRTQWGNKSNCHSWWMSATLTKERLGTVDFRQESARLDTLQLSPEEAAGTGFANRLIHAPKTLSMAPVTLSSATKDSYEKELVRLIAQEHKPDSLTLVVVNSVARARAIFFALTRGKTPLYNPDRVGLIHSRFRRPDRDKHEKLLFADADRIVIATQAVEAGVDVSAQLLISELAPWASLVQRMGRCNRRAAQPDARILVIDIQPKDDKDKLCLPYTEKELALAREALRGLSNASPAALRTIRVPEEPVVRPVLRRRDLIDLFDTTPDLCGQDIDISRYIRDGEDNDVQFFWRTLSGKPSPEEPAPERHELCRVSIGEANAFLKKVSEENLAWRWNPLARTWEKAGKTFPGTVILLDARAGGYDDTLGWTADRKSLPTPTTSGAPPNESYDADPASATRQWQTITEHTSQVVSALAPLTTMLVKDEDIRAALAFAARWHDAGKAHTVFQQMLTGGAPERADTLWAKSDGQSGVQLADGRRGFRHELASALAWLQATPDDAPEPDLTAYLIAAHHGKVRLSIRSLPTETGNPDNPDTLFARGLWHGDSLPAVDLGNGTVTPDLVLDLTLMQMGDGPLGPSWLARTLALRDRFGPFRLAFFETLLRAADARGSQPTP